MTEKTLQTLLKFQVYMANAVDAEFLEASRELGATNEDINLVKDMDFSGSEYEGEREESGESKDLLNDVEKLWGELSGDKELKKTAKPEKTKKLEKPEKVETEKAEKPGKERKEKKPRKETEKTEKSAPKPAAKPAAKSAPVSRIPNQIPKKLRYAWNDYFSKIEDVLSNKMHADELLLKDELLSDETFHWSDMCVSGKDAQLPTQELVDTLKRKARALLDRENAIYYASRSKERDFKNSLEFLKSGTFSDQLGTLSILATESPIHSLRFLDNLFQKCEIKNRESACKALEVFKDLIVSHILPDRRLKWFADQDLSPEVPLKVLVAWAFEDYFKELYFKLLKTMESLLADTVENIRMRTLYCVFDLFQKKPEQEANLLRIGVNKFGDSSKKVSSKVKKLILDTLQQHPGMKLIVASSIQDLLKRSAEYRVRYYAVDALSEFIFSAAQPEVPNALIHIYLNLFEQILTESKSKPDERAETPITAGKPKNAKRLRQKRGKKGGLQQKIDESELENQKQASLISKIFTGLNRAFPFSNLNADLFKEHTNTLYHMSHSQNVSTLIEALNFIFQLLKQSKEIGVDRFYKALYDSLLDTRLVNSSKLNKYILLMLRSMAELKSEAEISRANAFAKRQLEVAASWLEIGGAASLIHAAGRTPYFNNLIAKSEPVADEFDFKQRDPRFAKAETSHAWEIVLLQDHFHPTVSLYASNLIAEPAARQDLPLPDVEQYSLNSFLSKWSYKKPRAKDASRGASIFQPLPGFTDLSLGITQSTNDELLPASMQDWKSKTSIAPEENFLFQYFKERTVKQPEADVKESKPENDSDSENDEDINEDEISEAMFKNGPGDLDNLMEPELDDEDDLSDGDLEAGLDAAFASSSDDNIDADGDEDMDAEDMDGEEEEFDFANAPEPALMENEAAAGGEFADLSEKDESKSANKKRKREWNNYPTFLDADAFEEMYQEKKKSKTS